MGSARPSGAAAAGLAASLARQRAGDVIFDLATAGSTGVPMIATGLGCAVTLWPPRVSVLVDSARAAEFFAVLAGTQRIAAVFGRASDHEVIQRQAQIASVRAIRTMRARNTDPFDMAAS